MSQSLLLPAFVALFGVVAALFLVGYIGARARAEPEQPGWADDQDPVFTGGEPPDDDDYVEYTVSWDDSPWSPGAAMTPDPGRADDSDTEPLAARAGHLLTAPPEAWHGDPVDSWDGRLDRDPPPEPDDDQSWRDILADLLGEPADQNGEQIGFAHNGFHVDDEQHFEPLRPPADPGGGRHLRDRGVPPERPTGRHSRADDAESYGRHSKRGWD